MPLTKKMKVESEMSPHKDANPEKIEDLRYVYTSNDIHQKVFGTRVKDIKNLPWNRRIIKITSKETNLSIYRIWKGVPAYVESKDILYIDDTAKYSLIKNKQNNEVEITLSKGSWFQFYRYHFDNATRISFKLGFLSIVLGIVSFLLGILSICISCME